MFIDTKEPVAPSKPDLSEPSIEGLIYLLRNPDMWPVGFEWDYGHFDRCAVGLASAYWQMMPIGRNWGMKPAVASSRAIIAVRDPDLWGIFTGMVGHGSADWIADALKGWLDRYLARGATKQAEAKYQVVSPWHRALASHTFWHDVLQTGRPLSMVREDLAEMS